MIYTTDIYQEVAIQRQKHGDAAQTNGLYCSTNNNLFLISPPETQKTSEQRAIDDLVLSYLK